MWVPCSSATERFEADGANASRDFLKEFGIGALEIEHVWTSIALHTPPGSTQPVHPVSALVTAGVEVDVPGIDCEALEAWRGMRSYGNLPNANFREDILQAF